MTHERPDIFLNESNKLNRLNKLYGSSVSPVRRKRKIGAFTLIEIIVVISIIAMLTTLTIGMSKYLSTRSGVQKTQGIQIVFMHALDAFIEEGGEEENSDLFTPPSPVWLSLTTPFKSNDPDDPNYHKPDYVGIKKILELLMSTPAAVEKLRSLPEGALKGDAADKVIIDGFDQGMAYDHNGGLGGRPVLISAGPDRKFRTDDDIHSDKH